MTNKEAARHIGVDQYGQVFCLGQHPRKDLMEQLGRSHVQKMYCDLKDGGSRQTGYVISGLWIRVYRLSLIGHILRSNKGSRPAGQTAAQKGVV